MSQAVAYHRDPLGVLRRVRSRYGSSFTLRFPGKAPLVFVSERTAIPALLRSDPTRTRAGAARREVLPPASEHSPFGARTAIRRRSRTRTPSTTIVSRARRRHPRSSRSAGGARRCIGEALARTEFRAVLPQIRRLRLKPVARHPERMLVRGTVLVPHLGALVVARV